jgi:hypothetical protein
VQLGPTLTAVVARLELAPDAAGRVNSHWHCVAEPGLVKEANGTVLAESRSWATMRATQSAQLALHEEARNWLRSRLPGAFARSSVAPTTFALLLLDPGDPLDDKPDLVGRDRLRALGMTDPPTYFRSAEELPGLLTERVDSLLCPTLGTTDIHLLAGNLDRVRRGVGPRHGHHGDISATMVGRLVDSVELRNYMVLQAVEAFLQVLERRHATLRDQAAEDHRDLSARAVKSLRSQVMAQGLDLDSVDAALTDFRSRTDRDAVVTSFKFDLGAEVHRRDADAGRERFTPVDVISDQLQRMSERITRLRERDHRLRETLTTATALGASADTFRVSRIALFVALVSLVAAIISLVIAEPGPHSLLQTLLDSARALLDQAP